MGLLAAALMAAAPPAADQPPCVVPVLTLASADRAFAARFAKGPRRRSTESNVRAAFRAACAKGLLKGSTIPKLDRVSTRRLLLENQPNANVAMLEADQLSDRSWRLILGYPFVASDGSVNVPSAEEIEEAIHCAVRGATEQEQAETGRCLPD